MIGVLFAGGSPPSRMLLRWDAVWVQDSDVTTVDVSDNFVAFRIAGGAAWKYAWWFNAGATGEERKADLDQLIDLLHVAGELGEWKGEIKWRC